MSISAQLKLLAAIYIISLSTPSLAIISTVVCQQIMADALLQDPGLAYNDTVFWQTPANAENGSLTIFGCETYCAPGQPRMEPDCGNRLFQWLLPALFMAVSIAPPPVGWCYQVWTNLRPIADPFDAVLSVSHLLSVCQRCHRDAGTLLRKLEKRRWEGVAEVSKDGKSERAVPQRTRFIAHDKDRLQNSIALILYASLSIAPDLGFEETVSSFSALVTSSPSSFSTPALVSLVHRTASRLAEERARGLAQAWFATISCIASLILATVPALGGSSPSGAMVSAALVLAPLARDVLLSHAVGEFGSLHRVWEVLTDFVDGFHCTDGEAEQLGSALAFAGAEKKMQKLAFTAGTSWYQPRRPEQKDIRTWRHAMTVALLLADTLASFAAAAGALAAPPTYLNDRHFLMFGIVGAWMLSAITTSLLMRSYNGNFELLGFLVASKDMIVATVVPVLLLSDDVRLAEQLQALEQLLWPRWPPDSAG
ncbi:hypothetical protein MSAN_01165000 [Mycena sanguinolenta]|uniref:Uncharacterized protein n=1 Tax=Mycena sanguinolenta TaxID=230812 RepID=A0A8H6YN15_9AGAR|nr:hypothetical protein MSAN_01165000 [Mycena sanguinolenta]